MSPFVKPKFERLSEPLRYYHLAKLLETLYEQVLNGEVSLHLLSYYNDLRGWSNLPPWSSLDPKKIADEYHAHLLRTKAPRHQTKLLKDITTGDRDAPLKEQLPIAILLDNLRSAHNVGSIVRTTEAFSLGTIYTYGTTPTADNKQVQSTSMEAHLFVPLQPLQTLDHLPRPLIVLETSETATPIHEFHFPDSFTLAVGNEEYGCQDHVLEAADHIVTIPMVGRKNSLNVANAFAIAAAEIRRQNI